MLERLFITFGQSVLDILPITAVILFFQAGVLRRSPDNLRRILLGLFYTLGGLSLFRLGLDDMVIPLGGRMAELLAARTVDEGSGSLDQAWLLLFAASIGLSAAMIEPTLWAVAQHAERMSGGELRATSLRLVVSLGVSCGLLLGTMRIAAGIPILWVAVPLLGGTALLASQASRNIVALSLDTGALATSVVTVPLIAAFGISVARTLPGRDPVLDGFGLVFFALLTPCFSLLAFNALSRRLARRRREQDNSGD